MKFTVKIWNSKENFMQGNAEDFSNEVPLAKAISDAKTAMAMGAHAVEIYDSESGETYFHSEENAIVDLFLLSE